MVYKLSEPEKGGRWSVLRWVLLRHCLPVCIIIYVIWELLGLPSIWSFVASGVTALLVGIMNYCIYSRILRRKRDIGAWFVTLTEAGMMLETPRTGAKTYVAWQRIEQVRKVRTMLIMHLQSGMLYLFPLDSLSAERAEEMFRYCQARVKKQVPPEEQIRMPEECLSPTPFTSPFSPIERAELADIIVMQSWGSWINVVLCAAFFLSAGAMVLIWNFLVSGSLLSLGEAVFALAFLFLSIRHYLHPGRRLAKWIKTNEPGELHVTKKHVLAVTPGAAWSVLPVSLVSRALQLRHSYVYECRTGGAFSLGLNEQPPAHLPQPQKPRRAMRNLMLALLVAVLPALAFGAFLLFGGSDDAEYREAVQRGEKLAGYVESLTPFHGFPGKIDYCTVYSNEEYGYTTIYISWEDDTSCCLIFEESPAEPEP